MSAFAALRGEPNRLALAPVRSAAVVLVDGLGAEALAARAGHARTLAARNTKRTRIAGGFPTTTAAALATLTTGRSSGQHGLVGFSALDPDADRVVNQLRGFDDGTLPDDWQRSRTVFEDAADAGFRPVAIGPRHYAGSGFTRAVLRGAEYLGARTVPARFETLAEVSAGGGVLAYLYIPELDIAAHAEGWQSVRWTGLLEAVDAAVADAVERLAPDTGLLLTADHGMIDTAPEDQVFYDDVPGVLEGVRHVAGEPRCLQLHLEPGVDAADVAARWLAAFPARATVTTRDRAVADGWFGPVDPVVLPRIGDVLVAATGRHVFLRAASTKGRGMVGQHGSWSRAERMVPLLRFGRWG